MKQQYTVDAIYNNSVVDFSKQVMLKKMKIKGIKIACCSNSIKNSIEMMLNKAMILNYFDLILSNEDVKESKPSPQIYLLAMEKLGTTPEETIIVEDSPHGIEAATAS
jgi:beta-phosphoglucomutase